MSNPMSCFVCRHCCCQLNGTAVAPRLASTLLCSSRRHQMSSKSHAKRDLLCDFRRIISAARPRSSSLFTCSEVNQHHGAQPVSVPRTTLTHSCVGAACQCQSERERRSTGDRVSNGLSKMSRAKPSQFTLPTGRPAEAIHANEERISRCAQTTTRNRVEPIRLF